MSPPVLIQSRKRVKDLMFTIGGRHSIFRIYRLKCVFRMCKNQTIAKYLFINMKTMLRKSRDLLLIPCGIPSGLIKSTRPISSTHVE